MATRESFKKLKVDVLMKLAGDLGITIPTLKKTEIISNILTHQVPVYALPPVTRTAFYATLLNAWGKRGGCGPLNGAMVLNRTAWFVTGGRAYTGT
jgi:hypothetical protein